MEDYNSVFSGDELDDAIKEINNISEAEKIENIDDDIIVLIKRSNGTYARVSPYVLRGVTSQYITRKKFDELISQGAIKEGVEYNILEDE
jgi:hypothetical protein